MHSRFFRYTFVALILVIMNSNYAMSKRPRDSIERPRAIADLNARPGVETFLDTLDRGREIRLTEADFNPIIAETASVSGEKNGKAEVPNGFRIQCFASSQIERVRAEQKILESKVRYPVYIVFAEPYYKLLVGDFVRRTDAVAAASKLKGLGYPDAWVMRTKVWVKQ